MIAYSIFITNFNPENGEILGFGRQNSVPDNFVGIQIVQNPILAVAPSLTQLGSLRRSQTSS